MRKPIHKRKRQYPTVDDFWNSEEPAEFKMACDQHADFGKFRRWFKAQLKRGETMEKSFEDQILEKYAAEIDICMGDWDEKGVINRQMAVHKLDCTQFMSKEENKDYPWPTSLTVAPKMFDLSKGKRVKTTKEDLELKEKEKEARKETAI